MTQLVTGEAVTLDLRTAGAPSRALAAFVDALVQGLALMALLALLGAAAAHLDEAAAAGVSVVVLLAVLLGYPVVMETLAGGRTLGKLVVGLRVVRDDGGPVRFRHAITRGLLGLFVEKPGFTLGSAALITSLLNERGKRLGDFLAGTVVVQERVAGRRGDALVMPPPLLAWAATLDLSALPDGLADSARSYLERWRSLTPTAQTDLGAQLATAVAAVVSPPPPPGTPPWAYLTAVLVERRRRGAAAAAASPAWAPSPPVAPPSVAAAPPAAPAAPPPVAPQAPGPTAPGGFAVPE